MTRRVTSKEDLLAAAVAIAERDGVAALSIRRLAEECGVGVGTVYNYFPAKEDLTVAAIERHFAQAFYEDFCHPAPDEAFVGYCERVFERAQEVFSDFRARWLADAQAIPHAELVAARLRETRQLDHAYRGLVSVFERDPRIDRNRLDPSLSPQATCRFVLDCILGALRGGTRDCNVLFALLRGSLYGETAGGA